MSDDGQGQQSCRERLRRLERRLAALQDLGVAVGGIQAQISSVSDLIDDGRCEEAWELTGELLEMAEGLARGRGRSDPEEIAAEASRRSHRYYQRQHTISDVKEVLESGLLQKVLAKQAAVSDPSRSQELVAAFQSGLRRALAAVPAPASAPPPVGVTGRIESALGRQLGDLRDELRRELATLRAGDQGHAEDSAAATPTPRDHQTAAVDDGQAQLAERLEHLERHFREQMDGLRSTLVDLLGGYRPRTAAVVTEPASAPELAPLTEARSAEAVESAVVDGDAPPTLVTAVQAESGSRMAVPASTAADGSVPPDPITAGGAEAAFTDPIDAAEADALTEEEDLFDTAMAAAAASLGEASGSSQVAAHEAAPEPDPDTSEYQPAPSTVVAAAGEGGAEDDQAPGESAVHPNAATPASSAGTESSASDAADGDDREEAPDDEAVSQRVVHQTDAFLVEIERMLADPSGYQYDGETGEEVASSGAEAAASAETSRTPVSVSEAVLEAQRERQGAGILADRPRLKHLLRDLLPELLREEEFKQQLLGIIASECVVNPSLLGDLTGLRRFLAKEVDRAVRRATESPV